MIVVMHCCLEVNMSNPASKDIGTKKMADEQQKNSIKWGHDNIKMFLEPFQNYELLWNSRHEEYIFMIAWTLLNNVA